MATNVNSLVFVGLNGRAAALNCYSGATEWTWRAPKPSAGYVSLLLLNDQQLIVSVEGYTYCLDPRTGAERWANDLPGFGVGVTSIVALDRHNPHDVVVAAASADADAEAAQTQQQQQQ
jgi:outer membrane protein assembly factor BamB